jgi:hypothetical protein
MPRCWARDSLGRAQACRGAGAWRQGQGLQLLLPPSPLPDHQRACAAASPGQSSLRRIPTSATTPARSICVCAAFRHRDAVPVASRPLKPPAPGAASPSTSSRPELLLRHLRDHTEYTAVPNSACLVKPRRAPVISEPTAAVLLIRTEPSPWRGQQQRLLQQAAAVP